MADDLSGLSAVSSLIPGVGSLISAGISGISDFNQNILNKNQAQQQFNAATGANLATYDKNLVSAAQGAGMSPLAMLGVNPASGAVSESFNMDDVGSALSGAANNFSEGISGQDTKRANMVAATAAQKSVDLQNRLIEAQIDKTQAEATSSRMGALLNWPGVPDVAPAGSPPPRPAPGGVSLGEASKLGFYGTGIVNHIERLLWYLQHKW